MNAQVTYQYQTIHTPGACPDLESCIRTLIVSRGWQHSYKRSQLANGRPYRRYLLTASHAPAIPPAVICVANPTGFLSPDPDIALNMYVRDVLQSKI